MSRAARAARVARLVQREVERTSIRSVARVAGVSKGAIENLRRGAVPQKDTLERLEFWMRSLDLESEASSEGMASAGIGDLDGFLADFERVVRNLGGTAGDMSDLERRERIRLAIDGQIQSFTALSIAVPGRLYELRAMFESGECEC